MLHPFSLKRQKNQEQVRGEANEVKKLVLGLVVLVRQEKREKIRPKSQVVSRNEDRKWGRQ